MVDNCIAKDAKEPCICGLANFEGIGVGDRFEICHLQNVFGGIAVVYSPLNEAQETASLFYKIGHGQRHVSSLDAAVG
jgi:hypothetical protein